MSNGPSIGQKSRPKGIPLGILDQVLSGGTGASVAWLRTFKTRWRRWRKRAQELLVTEELVVS